MTLGDEMNKLIKSKNWKKLEDNFVFVANHEESIKTKNIVEKIKFEGMFTFHFNKYLRINGYKNLNFYISNFRRFLCDVNCHQITNLMKCIKLISGWINMLAII